MWFGSAESNSCLLVLLSRWDCSVLSRVPRLSAPPFSPSPAPYFFVTGGFAQWLLDLLKESPKRGARGALKKHSLPG